MSDAEDESASPLGQLQARHRRERKELQAKIQSIKKGAKSGNKKQQKEAHEQAEALEKALKQRHEKELAEFDAQQTSTAPKRLASESQEPENDEESDAFWVDHTKDKKKSKAMKRREKKEEDARRAEAAAQEDKANAKFSRGNVEWEAITRVLTEKGLAVKDILPDGDCLFNAIADQLVAGSDKKADSAQAMRKRAATYMRAHPDDFLPFLDAADVDGQDPNDAAFERYCQRIEQDSAAWGGNLELIALARSLERTIQVIQPEGIVLPFGEEFSAKKPLVLTFHRHAYALGEHYNSTRPITVSSES